MPAYIEVRATKKDRSKSGADIVDEPEHFVDVFIGPAILDPFYKLMQNLAEVHDENMEHEGGMTAHRKEEPKCEYCATIRRAQKIWKEINGRPL